MPRAPRHLAWLLAFTACHGTPRPPETSPIEGARTLTWEAPTGRVFGMSAGDPAGRRVILVHGTPGSATNYARYLEEPPEGLELIALDRPGFGASEPSHAVIALADQAAALEPLLEERDGSWPILVGHSLGGPIIVRAAIDYPGRVGGLVVLAGNLDPRLEQLRWYNHVGAFLSPFLSRSLRNSNNELGPQKRELTELEPLLAQVTCPVWIVHGTADDLVPYDNATFLAGALPNAARVELRTLEGVDHFFLWTHVPAVRTAIEDAAR